MWLIVAHNWVQMVSKIDIHLQVALNVGFWFLAFHHSLDFWFEWSLVGQGLCWIQKDESPPYVFLIFG